MSFNIFFKPVNFYSKIQSIPTVIKVRTAKSTLIFPIKKPTLRIEWENCYEKEIGVKHQLPQI